MEWFEIFIAAYIFLFIGNFLQSKSYEDSRNRYRNGEDDDE